MLIHRNTRWRIPTAPSRLVPLAPLVLFHLLASLTRSLQHTPQNYLNSSNPCIPPSAKNNSPIYKISRTNNLNTLGHLPTPTSSSISFPSPFPRPKNLTFFPFTSKDHDNTWTRMNQISTSTNWNHNIPPRNTTTRITTKHDTTTSLTPLPNTWKSSSLLYARTIFRKSPSSPLHLNRSAIHSRVHPPDPRSTRPPSLTPSPSSHYSPMGAFSPWVPQ